MISGIRRAFKEAVWSTLSAGGEWLARNGYVRMAAAKGFATSTSSGISVDEATAMHCATVHACIRAIADPIGFLPLNLYERVGPMDRRLARRHPLYRLLHDAPNPWTTATTFRQTGQAHLLTHGNFYAQILRRAGTDEVMQLRIMDPSSVEPVVDGGQKQFKVRNSAGREETWGPERMFHVPGLGFDGVKGQSVVSLARESIALAMTMEQYAATFFRNGGRMPYVLEHPQSFKTDQDFEQFKEKWKAAYGSTGGWHTAPILTGGLVYKPIGSDPDRSQLREAREFQTLEIARWYKVSPHKLADLSRATFSNIEHLNIEFLTETLSYWLKLWEQCIWLQLLNENEQERYYAEFNSDAILRGDAKSTAEAMAIQTQNALLQPNEGRRMYNRPAVSGGDINVIQLNMQTLPGQPKLSSQEKTNGQAAATV